MKTKQIFLSFGLLAFSALATSVYAQSASVKTDKPLNYSHVIKLIGQGGGDDAKILASLKGKPVSLTLVSAGPHSLIVKRGDGIVFSCDTRAPGFKKGKVNSTITNIETTHEGDISLSLGRCGV